MSHDPEGRQCMLTTVRTSERGPDEPLLDAEQLVDLILGALEAESLVIVRKPQARL